jgi:hypothetical protein
MVNLPEQGSGKIDFGLDWMGKKSIYTLQNMNVTLERSHVTGQLEVTVTDTLAYRNGDLHFTTLDTQLLTKLFPTMKFPRPLTLTGQAKFNGGEHSLAVNADVTVDDRLSGRSRLVANGTMGLANGVFNAKDLHVRMLPLQMLLAKSLALTLKLTGTMTGTATLNGISTGLMTAVGDVTEVENGAVTHATADAPARSLHTREIHADGGAARKRDGSAASQGRREQSRDQHAADFLRRWIPRSARQARSVQ